jgi:hypothetical protein
MFCIPWTGKMSTLSCKGKEGEHLMQAKFVVAAEDGLALEEVIGTAGHKAYQWVKAGKLGSVPVRIPAGWRCSAKISFDDGTGEKERTINQALPQSLSIISSKDEDQPPKFAMVVVFEPSEQDALFLLKCYKRTVDVEIGPQEGDQGHLPFEVEAKVKPPVRRRAPTADQPAGDMASTAT